MDQEKFLKEEEERDPVSPTGNYFNSSALSICVLSVMESEIPIDDSRTIITLKDILLPMSPRFSSIMVIDEDGKKQWKRVKVNLAEHVNIPVFPAGLSPESYDQYFQDYLSKIAMEQLPLSRPLWDIHIIKYPTSNAAGVVVIKVHHAMGDGFSLMGAIFSCVKRADDPSLPLTFPTPSSKLRRDSDHQPSGIRRLISTLFNTVSDFGFSLLKSNLVEDDKTLIRSGVPGVEFLPIDISTVAFSLDHVGQIKAKLGVTINDAITGIVFYGLKLYMESSGGEVSDTAGITALVLLNTRVIPGYKSIKEMASPDSKSTWGNQFGFLHVSVPHSSASTTSDPLDFIFQAKQIIQRKRSSLAVYLTGCLLETLRRIRGPEAVAKYIHSTLRNTSMTISNLIGPMEQMGIADHPVKGFYFMVVGVPQSLSVTLMSYKGEMRLAMGTERGFINAKLLTSSMHTAFHRIFEAALAKP